MKFIKTITASLFLILLIELVPSSFAFALLGPFAPWMQETNGVFGPSDIGGPMDIGSGYRWNVPVITYGFDKSFLDYFGSNGVAAVESAIQILNDLPPASQIDLTNYPFGSEQYNYGADVQGIYDLKSQTLSSLLEQLGLAQPTRNIFVMKQWTSAFSPSQYPSLYGISPNSFLFQSLWPDWFIPNFIVMRNFDPQTLAASQYINGTLYTAIVLAQNNQNGMDVLPANEFAPAYSAVADDGPAYCLAPGDFYTGLTYDDVGGLRYLLNADNVNYEKLLPDVHVFCPNGGINVNGAWRPGMEKVTFVRQPSGFLPGNFRPLINRYNDVYLKNNVLKQQPVMRITIKPDVLFCAADNGENDTNTVIPLVVRTGTAKWLNNAALNGNTNGEGPGVIPPPIKITLHKIGAVVVTADYYSPDLVYNGANEGWGSIGNSTNATIFTPVITKPNNDPLAIEFRHVDSVSNSVPLANGLWHLKIPIGGRAVLQMSTDQINWNSLGMVTNAGAVIEWLHFRTENTPEFFRAIPQ